MRTRSRSVDFPGLGPHSGAAKLTSDRERDSRAHVATAGSQASTEEWRPRMNAPSRIRLPRPLPPWTSRIVKRAGRANDLNSIQCGGGQTRKIGPSRRASRCPIAFSLTLERRAGLQPPMERVGQFANLDQLGHVNDKNMRPTGQTLPAQAAAARAVPHSPPRHPTSDSVAAVHRGRRRPLFSALQDRTERLTAASSEAIIGLR